MVIVYHSVKNIRKAGEHLSLDVDVHGCGVVTNHKFMCNKSESEFLQVLLILWTSGVLPSDGGLHPPHVCPPDFIYTLKSSQFFPTLPLPCVIMNINRRANRGETWERGCTTSTSYLLSKTILSTTKKYIFIPIVQFEMLSFGLMKNLSCTVNKLVYIARYYVASDNHSSLRLCG